MFRETGGIRKRSTKPLLAADGFVGFGATRISEAFNNPFGDKIATGSFDRMARLCRGNTELLNRRFFLVGLSCEWGGMGNDVMLMLTWCQFPGCFYSPDDFRTKGAVLAVLRVHQLFVKY